MKNLNATMTFTTAILLSISIGKYISNLTSPKTKAVRFKNTVPETIDYSLRNFHPNKGE